MGRLSVYLIKIKCYATGYVLPHYASLSIMTSKRRTQTESRKKAPVEKRLPWKKAPENARERKLSIKKQLLMIPYECVINVILICAYKYCAFYKVMNESKSYNIFSANITY